MFIFGMTVDEVVALKCAGYNAEDYVNSNVELAEVMEQLKSGYFSSGNADEFKDIVDNLLINVELLVDIINTTCCVSFESCNV